jgi:hypothetical protein
MGVEIDREDYSGLDLQLIYILYTYRNSIGDVEAPKYEFWTQRSHYAPRMT